MTELQLADVKACIEVLRKGGIIVYPTDTIWGIGCDACCPGCQKDIRSEKSAPMQKPSYLL